MKILGTFYPISRSFAIPMFAGPRESDAPRPRKRALPFARPLLLALFLLVPSLLAVSACSADIDHRGHVMEESDLRPIQIGDTSRDEIFALLGSPNLLPVTGEESWYYIGAEVRRFAFYKPELLERQVAAFHFDDAGILTGIDFLSLEDGSTISFVEETTPSRGRDLGLLEEIFGNIGRFTPAGAVPEQ